MVKRSYDRTALGGSVDANLAQRDRYVQARVRDGDLCLDSYLVNYRGYRLEELPRVRPRFAQEIFGGDGAAAGWGASARVSTASPRPR